MNLTTTSIDNLPSGATALAGSCQLSHGMPQPAHILQPGISYVYMDRFLVRRGIGSVTLSACQLLAASLFLAIVLGVAAAPGPYWSATTVAEGEKPPRDDKSGGGSRRCAGQRRRAGRHAQDPARLARITRRGGRRDGGSAVRADAV